MLPRTAGLLSSDSCLSAHLGHCWVFVDGTLVPVTLLVILGGEQACKSQAIGDLSYAACEMLHATSCPRSSHTRRGNQ